MPEIAKLWATIGADTTGLKKALTDTERDLDRSRKSMLTMGNAAKIAAGALAVGGVSLAYGLKECVEEAAKAQKIQAQLNAVLKSTQGVSGMTTKSVNAMAESLSKVTEFDDEAITSGASMLLTFDQIGKDIFPLVTETALDMSTALGQDLQSSVMQLGKALQDPVAGVGALQRVGVRLTESQKEQVKALAEAGDVMGAQKIILAELTKEFGGSARAAGETFPGQMKIFMNSLDNVKESIGTILLPALTDIVKVGGPKIAEFIQGVADTLAGGWPAISAELSKWPSRFWEWLTGKGGALEQATNELNKLGASIADWANSDELAKMFQGVGESIASTIVDGMTVLLGSEATGNETITAFHASLSKAALAAADAFKTIGADIETGIITGFWEKLTGKTVEEETADKIRDVLRKAAEAAQPIKLGQEFFGMWWEGFTKSLANTINFLQGNDVSWGDVMGSLPHFASGGIVPGQMGAPQLAVVHGGETILPTTYNQQQYNLTINSRAPTEPIIQDFAMLRSLSGA